MLKREDISENIVWVGCLGLPIILALFSGVYFIYKYVDNNWFFTDYTNFRVEEACKSGNLKRGIYSSNYVLYDQNSGFFDRGVGSVKVKDGEIIDVYCRVPGARGENIPTTVRVNMCGQEYSFNVREEVESPLD